MSPKAVLGSYRREKIRLVTVELPVGAGFPTVDVELPVGTRIDVGLVEAGLVEAELVEAELVDSELLDAELAEAELVDAELSVVTVVTAVVAGLALGTGTPSVEVKVPLGTG